METFVYRIFIFIQLAQQLPKGAKWKYLARHQQFPPPVLHSGSLASSIRKQYTQKIQGTLFNNTYHASLKPRVHRFSEVSGECNRPQLLYSRQFNSDLGVGAIRTGRHRTGCHHERMQINNVA